MTGVMVAVLVGVGLPALLAVRAHRIGRSAGLPDRRTGLDALGGAVLGLWVVWHWVPWDRAPPLGYVIPMSMTAYGVLLMSRAWRRLPWSTGRAQTAQWAGTLATGAVVLALLLASA